MYYVASPALCPMLSVFELNMFRTIRIYQRETTSSATGTNASAHPLSNRAILCQFHGPSVHYNEMVHYTILLSSDQPSQN